jgi:hypothetical protein
MKSYRIPSEEEVRAASRQGEEAVISLVHDLILIITDLGGRVQTLEDQISKNSGNSSPPVMG